MVRQWLIRAGAVVAGVGMLACEEPDPCVVALYSGGAVVATDTLSTEFGCEGRVFADSVGTDTTVAGSTTTVRTLYVIDSVVTDTTND